MKYQNQKIFFCSYLESSSEELKEIATLLAKKRNIKDYKSMSEDRLLSALKESE